MYTHRSKLCELACTMTHTSCHWSGSTDYSKHHEKTNRMLIVLQTFPPHNDQWQLLLSTKTWTAYTHWRHGTIEWLVEDIVCSILYGLYEPCHVPANLKNENLDNTMSWQIVKATDMQFENKYINTNIWHINGQSITHAPSHTACIKWHLIY